ncbi:nitrite reductase (NAD(P)H) small subunit family protein [Robbsia sp. KACC 23696]|uniref:nitrite reductase (NAD(P)H) small subunit family protein n=1 Tax=Robbsia sp. KACC 23696 TaxID=3149231 RepID=UPI00325B432C
MTETAPLPSALQSPDLAGLHIDATWQRVCRLDDIVPDTGVCALLGQAQVAVFRVTVPEGALALGSQEAVIGTSTSGSQEALFAIGNVDPHSGAAVLSRGVTGSLGARIVVASPLYKQHFDLRTGECIESPAHAVRAYRVALKDGAVWLAA